MLKHGSLFSGIGGFDLAAEWAGWENIFHCEWNEFGQKVLKHHFPKSISYADITKTDFSIHRGNIDIISGGFPCQPYSTAGKRLGKADERHLFPEMLRCVKEVKPRWIVGENVRGLVSWNDGLVFQEVYDDLEREGYEVQSFLIPAASVGAPHQRYRIWFVAYSNNYGTSTEFGQIQRKNGEVPEWNNNAEFSNTSIPNATNSFSKYERAEECRFISSKNGKNKRKGTHSIFSKFMPNGIDEYVTNSSSIRLEQCSNKGEVRGTTTNAEAERNQSTFATKTISGKFKPNWNNFPTKPPICGGDDGIPRELDSITFSKWRNESIKAYGNAIVPQVAYQIFKAINEFELMINK